MTKAKNPKKQADREAVKYLAWLRRQKWANPDLAQAAQTFLQEQHSQEHGKR